MSTSLAYFVTPHGFGHAARASAVMSACHQVDPDCVFHIYTTVPEWFFADALQGPYIYHRFHVDVGLIQSDPMAENLPATVAALERLIPFSTATLTELASQVISFGCKAVICDIAALGIAVGAAAGLPSVLIENFTWDWIYEGYLTRAPALHLYITRLKDYFAMADHHIQAVPVCAPGAVSLTVPPVFRRPRRSRTLIRRQLRIDDTAQVVLITMGGIEPLYGFLERLSSFPDITFIIPGAADQFNHTGYRILLPHRSNFYHPDLVFASDAVIGKAGYSTLAETYAAGLPYGYILRDGFRESIPMAEFIQNHMPGTEIDYADFQNGDLGLSLEQLFTIPAAHPAHDNGADVIARYLFDRVMQIQD